MTYWSLTLTKHLVKMKTRACLIFNLALSATDPEDGANISKKWFGPLDRHSWLVLVLGSSAEFVACWDNSLQNT